MRRLLTASRRKDLLTVGEAAEVLGVPAPTLRYWDQTGKLTAERHPVNGYRLFRRADVDAMLVRLNGDAASRAAGEEAEV